MKGKSRSYSAFRSQCAPATAKMRGFLLVLGGNFPSHPHFPCARACGEFEEGHLIHLPNGDHLVSISPVKGPMPRIRSKSGFYRARSFLVSVE